MNEILAVTLQGMQQDMTRLNHLGNNIANMLTPGFKRGVSVAAPLQASFASALAQASNTEPAQGGLAAASAVSVRLDTRPGSLRATGQSLDIAIAGQGYLEVSTPDGVFYARQGNLRLDSQSRLVTAQGHSVMGTAGEIRLKRANPVIGANGAISEIGPSGEMSVVGQLKVVRFESDKGLRSAGAGLFTNADTQPPVVDPDPQLKQGYLENSNVNSMQEMVQMIQTMRHFESMQKIAQGYDEMLGNAIRKLGDAT